MPPAKNSPAPPPAPPAPRWQSIATVLIILHLFCLAVAIVVNAGGGKSLVGRQLRLVPFARGYTQLLMMDFGYDFALGGAGPDDGIHRLRLLKSGVDADADGAVLGELPGESPMLRIRRQRYQHLAYHAAFFDDMFAENNDLRTQLPLAIAERWTRGLALPPGLYTLQCLRIPPRRLPKAIEADISYAYVMREGGLQQQVVETPPPDPINVFLVWDPVEGRYQGSREAPLGQRALVVRPAGAPPFTN
ncbi:MAG: hypothetical protein DCC67_06005 [Planctomycetota bacterium]|nr:MAG: hypothetical protein DCC67_06005 [Planctomycetota bacterium]